MNRIFLIILSLVFSVVYVEAQSTYPCVIDSKDGSPIPSVSLLFLDSLQNVTATGITDIHGMSVIKGNYKKNSNSLHLSCVGYVSRSISLLALKDTITLEPTHVNLEKVEVVAMRPLIKLSPGMFTYEVSNDSSAQNKSTLDVMHKVPLLIVSANNGISAENGKSIVYELNGMRDPLLKGDVMTIFQALKASNLKRIEVNTQPGLQYGSNIIVVNIVTKGRLEGLLGTLCTRVADESMSNSIFGLTKNKNLTVSLNYQNIWDYGHSRTNESKEIREQSSLFYQTDRSLHFDGFKSNKHSVEFSSSYETNNTTLINLYGRVILSNFSNPHENSREETVTYQENGALSYSYVKKNHRLFKNTEYDATISFEHSFVKNYVLNGKFYLGYNFYNRPYWQTTTSTYEKIDTLNLKDMSLNAFYNYVEKENRNSPVHTFEASFWHNITKGQRITLGGKLVLRPQYNERNLQKTLLGNALGQKEDEESFYKHDQQVANLYGSYEISSSKGKLNAGLRYEYQKDKLLHSDSNHNLRKHFSNLLPSLSLAYQSSDNMSMELSYDMSVSRPNISVLDPYVDYTTPLQLTYGNTDLKPENTNSVAFTINQRIKRYTLITSLSYAATDRLILNYQYIDKNMLHNTTGNIGKKNDLMLYNSLSGRLSRKVYARLMQSMSYVDYSAPKIDCKQHGWIYFVRGFMEYELPKGCYLNIEGSYRSKSILLQGRGDDKYYYSVYLSKYYFNNKLKLMLSADNFFNIHKINETEKATNNYTVKSYDKYYKASFMFSAILRLGKLKARVKETDKTIQRDTDIKYNYD